MMSGTSSLTGNNYILFPVAMEWGPDPQGSWSGDLTPRTGFNYNGQLQSLLTVQLQLHCCRKIYYNYIINVNNYKLRNYIYI